MKHLPNKIMLITYPDSLGGNLSALRQAMKEFFDGAAGGIHILPFFPSSGDRGFSPITYEEVDSHFGNWEDIAALSRDYYLMCDMMVNHISRQSKEFQDYLHHGERSVYAPMFLDYEKFFQGEPSKEEAALLYRRSDKPLYVTETLADGQQKKLWCSFSREQIDLDVNAAVTLDYIMKTLRSLGRHGISVVRMDAYGYITKIRGTNCFFVEPQIWDLIASMEKLLSGQNMTLLPEVHDRYETALCIADHGYYTYDFVLPMLMLHTLLSKDARAMKRWFSICPRHQFTVLDTHDGIGVYDSDGIVSQEEAQQVIRWIEPMLSYSYKPMDESKKKYYKSYQLYGTYYSILGENDRLYLLARAIQFFAPGIPQVYYVGMLAGKNDPDFPETDHRFINRHNYSPEELAEETRRPVVQQLIWLMRWRNMHPAFGGEMEMLPCEDSRLLLRYVSGSHTAALDADLESGDFTVFYTDCGKTICWKPEQV